LETFFLIYIYPVDSDVPVAIYGPYIDFNSAEKIHNEIDLIYLTKSTHNIWNKLKLKIIEVFPKPLGWETVREIVEYI